MGPVTEAWEGLGAGWFTAALVVGVSIGTVLVYVIFGDFR